MFFPLSFSTQPSLISFPSLEIRQHRKARYGIFGGTSQKFADFGFECTILYTHWRAHILKKTQQQALLGQPILEALRHVWRLISFVFIAVAQSWKTPTISFDLVKTEFSWIMINEKLSAILNGKLHLLKKTWDPWIEYFSGNS